MSDSLMSVIVGTEVLSAATPVGHTDPDLCKIVMTPSWNLALGDDLDEPIDVALTVGKDWALKMTQHTLYSLAGNFGITKSLLAETPSELTQPLLNYWLSVVGAAAAPRFVYTKENVAVDLFRPYNAPHLSAPELAQYLTTSFATQCSVDESAIEMSTYLTATFREMVFRMFLPPIDENLATSSWRQGVQVSMSPSGLTTTLLTMVFRRDDGIMVAIPRHEFKYSPKRHGAELPDYCTWLNECVGMLALEGQEERHRLAHLDDINVESELQNILNDLYTLVPMPMASKALINARVADMDSPATGYDLLLAIAYAATSPDEPEGRREKVRRAAGRLYTVLGTRCTVCHSLLKDHSDG